MAGVGDQLPPQNGAFIYSAANDGFDHYPAITYYSRGYPSNPNHNVPAVAPYIHGPPANKTKCHYNSVLRGWFV